MDSLVINTGEKRIAINNDPERVISFVVDDVVFVEKFYLLLGELDEKSREFESRAADMEKNTVLDESGIPKNAPEQISMLRDACQYFHDKIDALFGPGTSQKAFYGTMSLDTILQFFDGMTPYIAASRSKKIEKYTNRPPKHK